MFKAILDKLLFMYSRLGTIIVMAVVALIMHFSFYIYFGFEQLAGMSFMYIFPTCICLQSIALLFTEGNKVIPCVITLLFYGITFAVVLDSSCLFYLIPYSILYVIMYFVFRLFNSVHKHKVEHPHDVEEILLEYDNHINGFNEHESVEEKEDNDLWLDF